MSVKYYQVVRGGLSQHVSYSDHLSKLVALDEARRWNIAYQTDEYWVMETVIDGGRILRSRVRP